MLKLYQLQNQPKSKIKLLRKENDMHNINEIC